VDLRALNAEIVGINDREALLQLVEREASNMDAVNLITCLSRSDRPPINCLSTQAWCNTRHTA
jgi:hypothetical protein